MTTTLAATLTGQLADFVLRTDYEALPGEVRHAMKRALLDLLGCGLSGAAGEDLEALVRGIKAYDRGGDATIWGTGQRASLPMAAMANGTAAHARELDDCGGPGHVGTVVIPAALAIGEARRQSGREVLAAIALGYEALFRIGDGAGGHGVLIERGWHPISIVGAFGSAAAGGKLAGLDRRQLTWALGLAGSFAGGSWAFVHDGSMSKRWHTGRAAANGLEAVFLAREGFSGPTAILEPLWGSFYSTLLPDAPLRPDLITARLGHEYRLLGTNFKVHACCRAIHSYLDVLLRVLARYGATGDDIAAIEVEGTEHTVRQVGKSDVQTIMDGQLSLPYTLAVAAYTGQVTLDEYTPRWMADRRVRQLAANVVIDVKPGLSGGPGRSVRVRLKDGRVLSERTEEPLGSIARPLSDADLEAKFRALVGPVVGPARAEQIVQAIWAFDQLENVAEFTEMLAL